MKTTLRPGNAIPISIHVKESCFLDASTDAIGRIAVPGQGVDIAITAGARYDFGGYILRQDVVITLTQGSVDCRVSADGVTNGVWTPLALPYTLSAADDGKCFAIAAAGTLTVPALLLPRPSCALMPPPTGNLTLAGQVTGTRARSANPAGVALNAYQDSDGYGLSGS